MKGFSIGTLRSIAELRAWRADQRILGNSLGFVPTMGALHEGHLDLIRKSFKDNQATVVSIFVNPSQFAPHEDLNKYPRTMESDIQKITKAATDAGVSQPVKVFAPTVEEMYPSGITLEVNRQIGTFVEVLGYGHQLEGSVRPHFFRGVATVVAKLLNAVQPEKAYFGQKDMQQSAVIRRMVKDLLLPVDVVIGDITREPSGLAMSSRNEYLSPEVREKAGIVYKSLLEAKRAFNEGVTEREPLLDVVRKVIESEPVIENIEYVSLNDLDTLEDLEVAHKGSTLSMAVGLPNREGGKTRILDNIIL